MHISDYQKDTKIKVKVNWPIFSKIGRLIRAYRDSDGKLFVYYSASAIWWAILFVVAMLTKPQSGQNDPIFISHGHIYPHFWIFVASFVPIVVPLIGFGFYALGWLIKHSIPRIKVEVERPKIKSPEEIAMIERELFDNGGGGDMGNSLKKQKAKLQNRIASWERSTKRPERKRAMKKPGSLNLHKQRS